MELMNTPFGRQFQAICKCSRAIVAKFGRQF